MRCRCFSSLVIALLLGVYPSLVSADTTVTFDGRQFVNKGLIAFGRIANDAVDSYGETLGGLGSSIAFPNPKSFQVNLEGTSSGIIRLNSDRGYNVVGVTDYRARSHQFHMNFTASSTSENLALTYQSSTLYRIPKTVTSNGGCLPGKVASCPAGPLLQYTTGLDADSSSGASGSGIQGPNLPLNSYGRYLSVDQEGFAVLLDGALWAISDEYGPYIHFVIPSSGQIVASLRPLNGIVPKDANGADSFTAETQPTSGRADNQGFEALTFDAKTNTLWAMLQSATTQDSNGGDKSLSRNTRMFGWQLALPLLQGIVSGKSALPLPQVQVQLKYEYVVQLPVSDNGKTYAQSEMHVVDSTTFLVLARDGNGLGDTDTKSKYKQADLISTKGATNIAGSKYDNPANPIAPGGTLVAGITPVQYQSFVDLIDATQLAKFGLHNGGVIDQNLIASKLESLALISANDSANPDDYLLVVVSDNDFITTNGHEAGETAQGTGTYQVQAYSDSYAQQYGSQDTQVFVYRLTLPGCAV
ncbi:hypothetical protein K437DRAFT_153976 [Tilletiaria anomala UBC 951]|uniref:Phytase-like domain-containing protein n=1 Tax=Tilletiaria anomala (strain ATCC 24038 / CBS 436.72 / UBC 951) TaxID=1037660 RepID=A0A066VN66_TILAU|nr:uncharacterized protein K437DRAFT_153976 [Tilletiaria anomala UBC 951]KDN43197.1 hypothetical protein K437DRAFT_153976 [Tilletiaria anomala UBC 951]